MEVWDLNLRHLRAIAFIADLGTINAAASAVNLTQPAITQALSRIEAGIGVPLFERRHDGMAPTAAAELLVPRIKAALGHVASSQVTMGGSGPCSPWPKREATSLPARGPDWPCLRCTARSTISPCRSASLWSSDAARQSP